MSSARSGNRSRSDRASGWGPSVSRSIRAVTLAAGLALLAACGGPGAQPTPQPPPPPPPVNNPPQIRSLTASDARAEVDAPITLTAVVEDSDTPLANLTYTWSADVGTFSGTGATATWVAGQNASTPADIVLTLTVSERFTSGSVQIENKASSTATIRLHNSPKELREMSVRFLTDFANSKVSPDQCVSEFWDSCSGKRDELADVQRNRHDYEIVGSTLRPTSLSIAPNRLSAIVHTACSFTSRVIVDKPLDPGCQTCRKGDVGSTSGDCWTTNVYENGRWWLCTSNYQSATGPLTAWERAFFGNPAEDMDEHASPVWLPRTLLT